MSRKGFISIPTYQENGKTNSPNYRENGKLINCLDRTADSTYINRTKLYAEIGSIGETSQTRQ